MSHTDMSTFISWYTIVLITGHKELVPRGKNMGSVPVTSTAQGLYGTFYDNHATTINQSIHVY